MKKNSTADGKSTEPEDEDSKADGDKEKGDGEAETILDSTTKKTTKPAVKSAETVEASTDASIKDESDADENNDDDDDDDKKSEVDSKPKTGYKSLQKSYIKLVCVHCNVKCVTFKVNKPKVDSFSTNSFGSKLSTKKKT